MTSVATRPRGIVLEREQTVPRELDEVFDFFSDPRNLEAITPPWLRFRITGCSTPKIGAGTTIDYRLRLHGVPIKWRSLIRTWKRPLEFIDEQRVGPYRSWVHLHTFQETQGGVLVRDNVEYEVLGGALVDRLFVRGDLERIFDHRQERLAALLGAE